MAKRRAATEAERALWGAAMRDVRRLDPARAVPVFPPLPVPPPIPDVAPPPLRVVSPVRAMPGGVDGAGAQPSPALAQPRGRHSLLQRRGGKPDQ